MRYNICHQGLTVGQRVSGADEGEALICWKLPTSPYMPKRDQPRNFQSRLEQEQMAALQRVPQKKRVEATTNSSQPQASQGRIGNNPLGYLLLATAYIVLAKIDDASNKYKEYEPLFD